MRAFSSPRRSEKARSNSLWRRWRALSAGNLALALATARLPPLRLRQVFLGAVQLAAGFDHRELGLAQRSDGPIVAILRLAYPASEKPSARTPR